MRELERRLRQREGCEWAADKIRLILIGPPVACWKCEGIVTFEVLVGHAMIPASGIPLEVSIGIWGRV